ncbi:MAG: 4Fe-4S binding protein [Proteobacteria bacterium]|nr:4Fe-4S binding protein [Pseudomonadota bacterium]MBU1742544.1 4Fe-4S binding protein [Pseudomonadota bacterium]
MIANYGYKDGSGDFFIALDTDKCDGCGICVLPCPSNVLAVVDEDPNDPMREEPVAIVGDEQRQKLKYACAQCKPAGVDNPKLPCVEACPQGAIAHSW